MENRFYEEYIALKRRILEKQFSRMNREQLEAVFQVKGPLLILAGAGSGKTTVLVNRVSYLVRFGNAYHLSLIHIYGWRYERARGQRHDHAA